MVHNDKNYESSDEKYINDDHESGEVSEEDLDRMNNMADQNADADGTGDSTIDEHDGHRPPEHPDDDLQDDEGVDDLGFDNGEFSALNSALDELQGALDNLESRNDGIHQELLQLLQSNREIRTNMMEENGRSSGNDVVEDEMASRNGTQHEVVVEGAEAAAAVIAGPSRGIRCLANDLLSDLPPSIAKLDLGTSSSSSSPNPVPTESNSASAQNTAAAIETVLPDLIPSAPSGSSASACCNRPN